jgi:hypothetical protein
MAKDEWTIEGEAAEYLCDLFFKASRKEGDPAPVLLGAGVGVSEDDAVLEITAYAFNRSSTLRFYKKTGNLGLTEEDKEEQNLTATVLWSDGSFNRNVRDYDPYMEEFGLPLSLISFGEATDQDKERFREFSLMQAVPLAYLHSEPG